MNKVKAEVCARICTHASIQLAFPREIIEIIIAHARDYIPIIAYAVGCRSALLSYSNFKAAHNNESSEDILNCIRISNARGMNSDDMIPDILRTNRSTLVGTIRNEQLYQGRELIIKYNIHELFDIIGDYDLIRYASIAEPTDTTLTPPSDLVALIKSVGYNWSDHLVKMILNKSSNAQLHKLCYEEFNIVSDIMHSTEFLDTWIAYKEALPVEPSTIPLGDRYTPAVAQRMCELYPKSNHINLYNARPARIQMIVDHYDTIDEFPLLVAILTREEKILLDVILNQDVRTPLRATWPISDDELVQLRRAIESYGLESEIMSCSEHESIAQSYNAYLRSHGDASAPALFLTEHYLPMDTYTPAQLRTIWADLPEPADWSQKFTSKLIRLLYRNRCRVYINPRLWLTLTYNEEKMLYKISLHSKKARNRMLMLAAYVYDIEFMKEIA